MWGLLGGAAGELLGVYDLRKHDPANWPSYTKRPLFWGISALMVGFGGLLAYAYSESGNELSPILAINVGASAPVLYRQLQRAAPSIEPGNIN